MFVARSKTKLRLFLVLALSATAMVVAFQNCGEMLSPNHSGDPVLGLASLAGSEKEAFGRSFHPLTQAKCAGCHRPGGTVSRLPFGHSDLNIAFEGFSLAGGADVLHRKAVDNHGDANTANNAQNKTDIDNAYDSYMALLGETNRDSTSVIQEPFTVVSRTRSLAAGANATTCQAAGVGTAPTFTVNLAADLAVNPSTTVNGTFSMVVTKVSIPNSTTKYYCLSAPRIVAPAGSPLTLGQLYFRYNGTYLPLQATYRMAQATAASGQTVLISTATMQIAVTGDFNAADTIEIGFGVINN